MNRFTARWRSLFSPDSSDSVIADIDERTQQIDDRLRKIEEDLVALRSIVRTRDDRAQSRLKAAMGSLINTISLLPDLNIKGVVPTFPHQGFEITGEEAAFLFHMIRRQRPKLIMELGSGSSSVLFAAALRANGHGRLISIEHDPVHAEHTVSLLEQAELGERAELVLAPLVDLELDGRMFQWYNLGMLLRSFNEKIDLLFVDGPPGKVQSLSRYPALPMLAPHLAPRAVVVVDDGAREDEVRMVEMWRGRDDVSFESEALAFLPHAPVLLTMRESDSRVAELRFPREDSGDAVGSFGKERRSGTS